MRLKPLGIGSPFWAVGIAGIHCPENAPKLLILYGP